MSVPSHHKEIVKHLRDCAPSHFRAVNYGNNSEQLKIIVAEFGNVASPLFSTIGLCDKSLPIPAHRVELAAYGKNSWLPNALASSVFWLEGRNVESWPMVCEDVIKDNTKSTYRHMAYVPSNHFFAVSDGAPVTWLLGFPIKDAEIGLQLPEAQERAMSIFPQWLSNA